MKKCDWRFVLRPLLFFSTGLLIGLLFPLCPVLIMLALLLIVFCRCMKYR